MSLSTIVRDAPGAVLGIERKEAIDDVAIDSNGHICSELCVQDILLEGSGRRPIVSPVG